MPHLLTWKNSKTWPVPSGPITGPEGTPAGDLGSPTEGRNNSGANWRKRDVRGPVQGAVAIE